MTATSQSQPFLFEAFDLIGSTTILGTLYGIVFTLYCLCARSFYTQLREPDKQRQARFTLAYISLLSFCTTAFLGVSTRMIQLAYVNHPDFPGGPLKYENSQDPTAQSFRTAGGILNLAVVVMAMAIQIWRMRIIWSGVRYAAAATVLPLLLLFSYTALDVLLVTLPGSILPNWPSRRSYTIMVITEYAVLPALTFLVTGLVIGRILLVRRQCIKMMGTSDALQGPYVSVVAMLVESYALESVWSIVSAILYGLKSPAAYLFVENDSTIKVIAYFLVVYRVATGRGWTSETERELTNLKWNHGALAATDDASGPQSRASATTAIMAIGSPSMSRSELAV